MKINYIDLQAQYQSLKQELREAIDGVLDSGAYVLGPAVAEFERDFADFCGTKHAVGVSSGTSALVLSLRAIGVGPGDEVITAANTFIATAAAIAQTGARPVLVDVDPQTRNIAPALIEAAITTRTKAIIPVHLFGRAAEMDEILTIADRHQLAVIEDAAQAHGASYQKRRAGSMGRLAAFSFYPAKNLGAFGEAGAVTTDDDDLARVVRMLRDHGSPKKYEHELLGYNARMDGLQGAVLGVKLKHLERWNAERNRVAKRYDDLMADLPVTRPSRSDDHEQVYHVYVIESDRRDELQAYLTDHGVPTIIHYPIPIHRQPAFECLGYREGDLPVAERLSRTVLSLPIYPEMTDEQVAFVSEQVRGFFTRS
jgi:dTDP-4-amino-4,6-dideoxygalactose transaminase